MYSGSCSGKDSTLVCEKRMANDVPVIEMYTNEKGPRKPLVIMSHGFTGNKENFIENKRMEQVVKMGYYVIAIDNRLHGERPGPDFHSVVIKPSGKVDIFEIRKAIRDTADDIKGLLDYYSGIDAVDISRVCMMGISMGGFTTYRAVVIDDRIKVAIPFISSPFWDDIPGDIDAVQDQDVINDMVIYSNEYSPGNQIDRFYPRAILAQIGDCDNHFKKERVEAFFEKLVGNYEKAPESIKLLVYPGVKHEVTDEMWVEAFGWLEKHL